MTLRMYVFYSAILCAWAGFLAWGMGRLLTPEDGLARAALQTMLLGGGIAAAWNMVDGWWSSYRWFGAEVGVRMLVGGVVGLIGGLLGGMLGYGLSQASGFRGLWVIGWSLMGMLIGAAGGTFLILARVARGEGAAGAMRSFWCAVIGVAVGATAGGVVFLLLGAWLASALAPDSGDALFPGALAGTGIGFAIGLAPALLQYIYRIAWIRIEFGPQWGRELLLTRPQTTIGQADECDIPIEDDDAEERHAQIVQWGSAFLLADIQSRSGTFLNERRIGEPTLLRSGDRIRIGASRMFFRERRPAPPSVADE